MIPNYSPWNTCLLLLWLVNFTYVTANYRENLAIRHPCNVINKRLEPYITWTEKLASSQYKVQKDACGRLDTGPACCTDEIMNSYSKLLSKKLQTILNNQLDELIYFLSISKQQIDIWSNEYITETRRLTTLSLETLFGTKEYRFNIDSSVLNLFNTLSNSFSSVDDVSRSATDLFNRLIISLYRRFIINNDQIVLDDNFQKCLINKAFNMEALPKQRELLYILTSGSSLIRILYTMLIYIEADIQRLKLTGTMDSNQCIHRYARETLCPICVSASSSSNQINNNDINEALCENDCKYIINTCFNQSTDSYTMFASIMKDYSNILEEIEQAVLKLQLVERLAKLHIYLYDMVVNVTNSRQTYVELQTACPNQYAKSFSPILSLPATIMERRELVSQWNSSLHVLLKRTKSSINKLDVQFANRLMIDTCSNSIYASKSDGCTQIDKQTENFIQWPLPPNSNPILNINNFDLAQNQLDELRKKLSPIQQMISSLEPKEKFSLIEYIPNFESYNDDINDDDAEFSALIDTIDGDTIESLSEQIYRQIDEQTTRRTMSKTPTAKTVNHAELLTYSLTLLSFQQIVFSIKFIVKISHLLI